MNRAGQRFRTGHFTTDARQIARVERSLFFSLSKVSCPGSNAEVAVGFPPNALDYPRHKLAFLANDQSPKVINVLPFDFEISATG